MTDFIVAAILLVIVGAAARYVIRAKKRGVKCIGCPDGGNCAHKQSGDCNCGCCCGCDSEASTCGCHTDTK